MSETKALFFEEKYGVDPSSFETTEQIDLFVSEKEKKNLVVRPFGNRATARGGNVFRIKKYNLEERMQRALRNIDRANSR